MSATQLRAHRLALVALLSCSVAAANPLAGLAPDRDARKAIAIGPAGEVYTPDGKGDWVRTTAFTTADKLSVIGRTGGSGANGEIVAWGEGVVYKLADNGWSAIRLHQTQKAMMSGGPHAVAAVKRQLYALDRVRAGEPEKIALAPADIRAIGSGKGIVIATSAGLLRVAGTKLTPLAKAPKQFVRLIDDRWVLVQGGIVDLTTNQSFPWPAGTVIGPTQTTGDRFDAVARIAGKLELVTLERGKLARIPIAVTGQPDNVAPVGLVVDKADRATVALADGRILTRSGQTWAVATVRDALPPEKPGSPPARSP